MSTQINVSNNCVTFNPWKENFPNDGKIVRRYQLKGSCARVCHYLSYPANYIQDNHSSTLLKILLVVPSFFGVMLCNIIESAFAAKISPKTYFKERAEWTKKTFHDGFGRFDGVVNDFVNFCIKNQIHATIDCPFNYIAYYSPQARQLPYLYEQLDSYYYGLDKQMEGNDDSQLLMIMANYNNHHTSFPANQNLRSILNNNGKEFYCGAVNYIPMNGPDRFSIDKVNAARADILGKGPNSYKKA